MRKFFLEVLGPMGSIKKYSKGSIVGKDIENVMFIVKSGSVHIFLEDIEGHEQMIYRLYPGEILGEFSIFSEVHQNYTLEFLEDSELWKIEKNQIDKLLEKNPAYYRYFIHSMSRKYYLSIIQTTFNKFYSSEERLIEFLLRIAKIREPEKEDNVKIEGYTHMDIGSGMNISRIGVTKLLKNLEKQNLIEIRRRMIIIISIENLVNYRENIRKI
jgi:CRP-like cAMP-binding protein